MSDTAATTADSALPLSAPVTPALPLAPETKIVPLPNLPLAALDSLLAYQTPSISTNAEPPCKKIYIGNLPESTTLADLEDCFGQLDQCTCQLKRGFGFVEYTEASSALEAVAKYHEGHFLGAQIKVELSHAKSGAKAAPVNEEGKVIVRNPPGSDRPSDSRKPMHINGPPSAHPLHPRSTNNGKTYNRNNNFNNQPHQNNAPYQPAPAHRMPPPYNNDFDRFGPPPFSGPPPPRGDVPYGRYPRDDYRPLPPPPPPPQMNPYPDPRYATGEYDRYGPPPPRGPPQGYSLQRDRAYDPYYDTPTNRDYSVYGSTPAYGVPPPPPSSHADGRPLYNSLPPPTAAAYGAPLESYYDYSTASAGTPSSNVRPQEGMGMGYVPMREGYEQQQRAGSFGAGDRYDPRGPAGREGRGERAGVRYTPYGRPERAAEGDSYRSPRNGTTTCRSLSPPSVRTVPLLAPGNGLPRRPVSPPSDYQLSTSTTMTGVVDEYNPRR